MVKNTKSNDKDMASKRLAKLERYINTHKGDVKYTQGTLSFTPLVAGSQAYVSGVGQGDTSDTRTGLKINAHTFYFNANFNMTASCNVRFIIVRDLMNQGVVPLISEVLENVSVISPLDYNNFVAQKRFVLLKDFTKHFTTGGVLYDTSLNRIPMDVQMSYGGTGFAVADARKNSIFVCCVTDTSAAGTIEQFTRLEYTDE
jgi:hypothetical protein